DTANMYVNAVYRYTKASKEYYLVNISLDQVAFGEGDILKSINGKKVTKDNLNELIEKYSSVNYKKPVKFVVKRNNKLVELSGSPLLISKDQKNLITTERNVKRDRKTLRSIFSSGKTNRSFQILN